MNLLRKLWYCAIRKQHAFGRARDDGKPSPAGLVQIRYKRCRLCGEERHVKRRKGAA